MGYPEREEEIAILERFREKDPLEELQPVIQPEQFVEMQAARRQIRVSEPVRAYIADIVRASRSHAALQYGASPRASIGLMRAAQGMAALQGRSSVLPDDVKQLAGPVLCHRLILKEEERLRGTEAKQVIEDIIEGIPVPVGE